MNNLYPYKAVIIHANLDGMVVRYSSPGHKTLDIGTPAPREGEEKGAVIDMYAPHRLWHDAQATRVVPAVGESFEFFPPSTPVDVRTPLKAAQDQKLQDLAAWRYQHEVSGVFFENFLFSTDRASQAAIRALAPTSLVWKTADGHFLPLSAEMGGELVLALNRHVQSCFEAEAQIASLIHAAETVAGVEEIEFPDRVV